MTRQDYIVHWAKELKKLIEKRTKLSERYQSADTSHKQMQKLNTELNWCGMHIAQAEERLCFALGQLLPENAQVEDKLCNGLNESANIIFQNNKEKGFWDNERNVGEMLMLVVSELGEAMEAHRKGKFAKLEEFKKALTKDSSQESYTKDFKSLIKDTFEDEIADAIIRLLDLSAGLGIDIEFHIREKVKFNTSREKLHGKLY